jgi:hypothetical protein
VRLEGGHQQSGRFFAKKRRKKLLFARAWDGETSTARMEKILASS